MADLTVLQEVLDTGELEALNTKLADSNIKLANLATGEYVATAKYNTLLDKVNHLQGNLEETKASKEELETLRNNYTKLVKEHQELSYNTQLDLTLAKAGVKDTIANLGIKELIKSKGLQLGENGQIEGLDEVINTLRSTEPKYFIDHLNVNLGANPPITTPEVDVTKCSYKELLALHNKNK